MTAAAQRGRPRRKPATALEPVIVRPRAPFDLALSLKAAASFLPLTGLPPATFRMAVEAGGERAGERVLVEVSQPSGADGALCCGSKPALPGQYLQALVEWVVSAELDLSAFYAVAAAHPAFDPVVRSLQGVKPLRPATLFEMAITAITEQQLSLAAAFRIRDRLVTRFGVPLADLWIFPSPARLTEASTNDLAACGLSRRKAEYVKDLARRMTTEAIEFETLRSERDERIREALLSSRGFGKWSVEYVLARGFGRTDSLPAADTGLQRVVGRYLADGRRLTAAELEAMLAPLKPYRGLAAYYLAVHARLRNPKLHEPLSRHADTPLPEPAGAAGGTPG